MRFCCARITPSLSPPAPPPQTSTLYYEVIDLPLPEYENLMSFKVGSWQSALL